MPDKDYKNFPKKSLTIPSATPQAIANDKNEAQIALYLRNSVAA
ncbi:hypothetical protein [Nostoc sp. 'Lobaria pulmonaria (5183) cyanobiont']|nr:hypothetical protein [Nostoc sp. 'Lobaria pulmonaria (5183) cyanobiont']